MIIESSSNSNNSNSNSQTSNNNSLEDIIDPTLITWKNFPDYRFIEYYLKTAFGFKIPTQILSIHNVKNEDILNQIEDKPKFMEWTYGWCQLKPSDYPDKIGIFKTKGYTDKNKLFIVGSIPPQILGSFGNDLYFLFCKIIIGHSLGIKADKVKDKKLNEKKIPNYYNSYKLLTPENMIIQLNPKDISLTKGQMFQYEILKQAYICPLYIIKLQQIKENIQRDFDNYYCCKCRQKEAEVFCLICESYYDKECYTIKHKPKGKNELFHGEYQELTHKQKQGFCSEHEDKEAEYYCLTCKKPICSRCKIIVNGISLEHSNHYVKDIFLAYDEEIPNFFYANEIRNRCVKQLKKIKQTVKSLIEKQISIEKEIDHEFRDENDSIQSLTKEAKLKHFSVIAELNEMKKHLINMDSYFHKCKKTMLNANLKQEAIWVKDNYEEIINDMFKNFDEINLDYKVNPNSFLKIKQTELRIIKKIDIEKDNIGTIQNIPFHIDKLVEEDKQYYLTKKIVSLKHEKEEARIQKNKQAQDRGKQDFQTSIDPLKYVLDERGIDKQNEIINFELKRELRKLSEKNNNQNS